MLGELVDKLSIANAKLFALCNKKTKIVADPCKFSKEEVVELISNDIELCKQRAYLKNKIDKVVGKNSFVEVKNYGN